jgi:TolA-binding protein
MFLSVRRVLRTAALASLLIAVPFLATSCKKKTPEERFEEARSLVVEQRQIPLGVLKLRELIKDFPEEPIAVDARFMLAEIYMSLGRRENMENAFRELEVVYTKFGLNDERGVQAHQFASQVLFMMEDRERAMAHALAGFEGTTTGTPQNIEMGFLLSQMRLAAGDDEQKAAAEAFFQMVALEAEDPLYRGQAREMIADYFRKSGRFEESNAVYNAHLERFPDDEVNAQIILAKALNFRLAGDEDRFEQLFEEGATMLLEQVTSELNPTTKIRMQRDTARLFEVAGKVDRSEAMLRQIMSENVGRAPAVDAQFGIGELFLRTGNTDRAREVFEAIRRENPGTQLAQNAEQGIRAAEQIAAQMAAVAAQDGKSTPTLVQRPGGEPTLGGN